MVFLFIVHEVSYDKLDVEAKNIYRVKGVGNLAGSTAVGIPFLRAPYATVKADFTRNGQLAGCHDE